MHSHQTRMTRINRAIRAKLDGWTFWVYSRHSRDKFALFTREIRAIRAWNSLHNRREFASWEGLLSGSSSLVAKCIPVFVNVRRCIYSSGYPTYNHNKFVLHCCLGFSASARNDVTARASSWLVYAARISAKVQIFQLARIAWKKRSIRTASFARIAPQDCLSRLCIDLTCKSFTRFASFASGVNAPLERQNVSEVKMGKGSPICEKVHKKILEYFKNNVNQHSFAKALQISSST